MIFVHRTITLKLGEQGQVSDTAIVAGTHLEPDGKGGWNVIIHVLDRAEGSVLNGIQQALTQ